MEEGFKLVAHAAVEQNRLRPAFACAQHVAIGEAAARHQRLHFLQPDAASQQIAHMHVHRIETGAVESGRHLNMGVDALLAQHRNFGARAGSDKGRGDIFLRLEGQMNVQARIAVLFFAACSGRRRSDYRAGAASAVVSAHQTRSVVRLSL